LACSARVRIFWTASISTPAGGSAIAISAPAYGVLVGVQATTAIVSYVPVARLADRIGRKPFVIATFVAFSAFPVAVVLAHDFTTLVGAFIVGGLREVGEPARKAMIVDLVRPSLRARSIGLYYLVRSLTRRPPSSAVSSGRRRRIFRFGWPERSGSLA
jgi:MFS family permease